MRSNPYSLDTIREVYDLENRKGMIDLAILPEYYRELVKLIHDKKTELSRLKKVSRKNMDEDAKAAHLASIEALRAEIKKLALSKEEKLHEILIDVESHINSNGYKFEIIKDNDYCGEQDKESFNVRSDSLVDLIMSKLLCRDLANSFKVKAANRHHIMTTLKGLLVYDKRFIVIRTDIKDFFESIPHNVVFSALDENHFLSKRTKSIIFNILHQLKQLSTKLPQAIGVPRGIGISSSISEIIMREFDSFIKGMPNVIFYARYVDDIIVILSHLDVDKSEEDFFNEMKSHLPSGLTFHELGSDKSKIIDYNPNLKISSEFTYLGYKIILNPGSREVLFQLSKKRFDRLKKRIDNLFNHFMRTYKSRPQQARKDLIDGIKLISGNVSLHKIKCRIKTGLYYNNDLLTDDLRSLKKIQGYYIHRVRSLNIDITPFAKIEFKNKYLRGIQDKLLQINFQQQWRAKKIYSFPINRLGELSKILGE